MTTRHVTLLAIAACGGVPPPAAPTPQALIAVEQAPRITVVDQRLATTPCPPARELGPGTRAIAIGGTRALDVESASVVSLADRSAVVIANVVDQSVGYGGRRELWWWNPDGTCRWRVETLAIESGAFAVGDRVWLRFEHERFREIDRDGHVHREVVLHPQVQQLVGLPGNDLAASRSNAREPTELWSLHDDRWQRLASVTHDVAGSALATGHGELAYVVFPRGSSVITFATLTIRDPKGHEIASSVIGSGLESVALAADDDGWVVAALTHPPTPGDPGHITIHAFDRALHPRWTTEAPAPAGWISMSQIDARAAELELELDERGPGRIILDRTTGAIRDRQDRRTLAAGETWRGGVVHDNDAIAGHSISTEHWLENRITGTPDDMPGSTFVTVDAGALVLIPPSP